MEPMESLETLINNLAPGLSRTSGIPESLIRDRLAERAAYVALPSSQRAIAKAEGKRQRKTAQRLKSTN
jgi:hypothetical protein